MNHTIAVELAKSVFEITVSEAPGQVSERHRLRRSAFSRFFAKRPAATVVMEACSSAHFWARRLREFGHSVLLLPPHHVRRYREHGKKTDRVDAKALLEAFRNEEILPVPVKSEEQRCLAALHRLRSRWMATRTGRINTLRGLLREIGLLIPVGSDKVVSQVRVWLADSDSRIPAALRHVLREACDELRELEARVDIAEKQLSALTRQVAPAAQLQSIPGIGLLTATALVGFVGDAKRFPSGRRFASYLGLTPREHSSGLARRLGAISKKGGHVLAHAPDPRRARRARYGSQAQGADPAGIVGPEGCPAPWPQHCHGSPRQQTRPDRLGHLEPGLRLRPRCSPRPHRDRPAMTGLRTTNERPKRF